jgi:hypothetical protein
MATTNWQIAGSDDWDDPSAWDNGVPTSSTDAVVDGTTLAPGLTVTFDNTGTESANSLAMTDSTLAITSGELSLGTASTLDDVSLTGGLLDFANTGGVVSTITGTLSDITSTTYGTLEIDAGTLELDGYATFDGIPSIDLANGSVFM